MARRVLSCSYTGGGTFSVPGGPVVADEPAWAESPPRRRQNVNRPPFLPLKLGPHLVLSRPRGRWGGGAPRSPASGEASELRGPREPAGQPWTGVPATPRLLQARGGTWWPVCWAEVTPPQGQTPGAVAGSRALGVQAARSFYSDISSLACAFVLR